VTLGPSSTNQSCSTANALVTVIDDDSIVATTTGIKYLLRENKFDASSATAF
jgi:hypothetical protein